MKCFSSALKCNEMKIRCSRFATSKLLSCVVHFFWVIALYCVFDALRCAHCLLQFGLQHSNSTFTSKYSTVGTGVYTYQVHVKYDRCLEFRTNFQKIKIISLLPFLLKYPNFPSTARQSGQ